MASENIMMAAVKRGGDRQALHERIRVLSQEAGRNVKDLGQDNNLIDLIAADPLFGMSREELTAHLAADAYRGAQVHFIGHLQRNKVNKVVGHVDLIQSVGSEHLLQAVEAQADKLGLVQDILLEVNIGMEESKGGVDPAQLRPLAELAQSLPHVRLRGLMAIPPISPLPGANRPFFAKMYQLFVDIRREMSDNQCDIDCLSMGMSGDFEDAIAEGATLVRVGTALFGPRPPMHTAR